MAAQELFACFDSVSVAFTPGEERECFAQDVFGRIKQDRRLGELGEGTGGLLMMLVARISLGEECAGVEEKLLHVLREFDRAPYKYSSCLAAMSGGFSRRIK